VAKQAKPLPALEWLQPRLKLSRALSLFNFVALFAVLAIWNLGFADLHGANPWIVISIQLVPLLLCWHPACCWATPAPMPGCASW